MSRPTLEITDVKVKDTIASARVNISYHKDGKSFDSFGTLTYVLTDPDLYDAPIEDIKSVLRGFLLCMFNDMM